MNTRAGGIDLSMNGLWNIASQSTVLIETFVGNTVEPTQPFSPFLWAPLEKSLIHLSRPKPLIFHRDGRSSHQGQFGDMTARTSNLYDLYLTCTHFR